MNGPYQKEILVEDEERLFALVTRELEPKDLYPPEVSRLIAYGKALEKVDIVFGQPWFAGDSDPAAFLSLHALLKGTKQLPVLPRFHVESSLGDICKDIGRSRTTLKFQAKQQGHSSLDAYLLTEPGFRAAMKEKGEAVYRLFVEMVRSNSQQGDQAIVCGIASCSLTVGLLEFFENTEAARKEVVQGLHHKNKRLPQVRLIRDPDRQNPETDLVMVEMTFQKGKPPQLVKINYLGDDNILPLLKKP